MSRFGRVARRIACRPYSLAAVNSTSRILEDWYIKVAWLSDAFSAVKRGERFCDAGDLPLVYVEVLVNGFGGEKRTAPTGTLGQLLKPRFC